MAVLIKSADERQPDLDALTALLSRPDLSGPTRQKIEQEIRNIRAGTAGESEAAYEIDFHYADSTKCVVLHDLRIEVGGHVAQVDHLLMNRLLGTWVIESKHFAQGVGVNEQSEWVAFWNGRPHGIASPIEQNRKHVAVLREAFDKGLVQLPKRLGLTLKPQMYSLVLVSTGARISRPKSRAAQSRVDGLDSVVKVDQLATTIDKQIDQASALSSVGALARMVGMGTLEDIGKQLVALHRPIQVDWAARFGLSVTPVAPPTVTSAAASFVVLASDRSCASCGSPVSPKVAAYCDANAHRFAGRTLCYDCQRRKPPASAPAEQGPDR
jgi:hypothetical protein